MRRISHYISLLSTHVNNRQSGQTLHRQQKVLNRFSLHTGLSGVFSLMLVLFCGAMTVHPNGTIQAQISAITWDHEYLIGPDMGYLSLAEALASLPENAGNVHFRLSTDLSETEDLFLPADKGINHLQIDCDYPDQPVLIDLSEHDLFANGIPLTIESGITFTNGRIFGGAKVPQDASAPLHIKSTNLTINGGAGKVFGGGLSAIYGQSLSIETVSLTVNGTIEGDLYGGNLSLDGGHSEITQSASVLLKENGLVRGLLLGGSWASGENSQTFDAQTSTVIEGTVEGLALGGSNANEGGHSLITGSTSLLLKTNGLMKGYILGGSLAYGENSQTFDVQTSAMIEGTVEGLALGGSLAQNGGYSQITQNASIQLTSSGFIYGTILGGSWSLGQDSHTSNVQTSAVIEGTVDGSGYGGCVAEDGGHSQITQNASLQLKAAGLIRLNAYGGSRIAGENSEASDVQTSAVIEGTIEGTACGGNNAQEGGRSVITQSTSLLLKADGLVKGDIHGGSRANAANSQTSDTQTNTVIEGTVEGSAYGGSIAQAGGQATVSDQAEITVSPSASFTTLYAGGGANGEGSLSSLNQVRINLPSDSWNFQENGLSTEGGQATVGEVLINN